MPLLKTKKAMAKMDPGQVIEVLGTDPGSKKDLADFAEKTGNELLSIERDPDGFDRYYLRKA
jgi:tRNA 2-thiouridine synthesizing protein A